MDMQTPGSIEQIGTRPEEPMGISMTFSFFYQMGNVIKFPAWILGQSIEPQGKTHNFSEGGN
jgi:hypothetical protein